MYQILQGYAHTGGMLGVILIRPLPRTSIPKGHGCRGSAEIQINILPRRHRPWSRVVHREFVVSRVPKKRYIGYKGAFPLVNERKPCTKLQIQKRYTSDGGRGVRDEGAAKALVRACIAVHLADVPDVPNFGTPSGFRAVPGVCDPSSDLAAAPARACCRGPVDRFVAGVAVHGYAVECIRESFWCVDRFS